MSRLDNVIESVKAIRTRDKSVRAWIFDDNGNIKDNVICGDVLPYLEELKDYEIEVTDDEIEYIKYHGIGYNTYNVGANICNDINFCILDANDGSCKVAFMVHLCGDIRGGYTDYFVCEFTYESAMFELESAYQHKSITDNLCADINIFSEGYEVYDYDKDDSLGFYCELEVEYLLKELNL